MTFNSIIMVCSHTTSFTPRLLIEVPIPSQVCVLEISFLRFLRFFDLTLELFQQCGIFYFKFSKKKSLFQS